ncbi:MAG: hypothetical protein HQ537_00690 [Parcubacteria group bacterium]|nr:hypothetical protein [Parcubacteria group bacterium]
MSEKHINKIPEVGQGYSVLWCNFHPILLMSEGIGINHALHFFGKDEPYIAVKVRENKQNFQMMVIVTEEVNFAEDRAMIPSRSGERFYSVDGKDVFSENGYLVPKFAWTKIKPLADTGIEIWQNVLPGSERDQKVKKILAGIGKGLDQEIPGLFDRVMSQVAKITTEDIVLAGATDFTSLFGLFGIRIWAVVNAIVQKADLSLPFYDTAVVNRFQLATALEPFNSLTKEQERAINKWLKALEGWQKRVDAYDAQIQ